MRISTSTNICGRTVDREGRYTWRQAIDKISAAGFEAVDINFSDYERPGQPLAEKNWRSWAAELKEYTEEKRLPITQGHAHFYSSVNSNRFTPLEYEEHERLICRDIEAAGICGMDWLVIHPDSSDDEAWYSRRLSLQRNRERFLRFGELASRYGVGIAIENMIDIRPVTRFAGGFEDLLELLDLLGDDERFGICLDTGHANLTQINQPAAIRAMGKRLRALHINDNRGVKDDHILPFTGTIRWSPLMKALGEIDYQGEFTYEIHNFASGFEDGFHDRMLQFSLETARYLVGLAMPGKREMEREETNYEM